MKLEPDVSAAVNPLIREFFSIGLEVGANEPVSILVIEFLSARAPLRLIELEAVLNMEFFSPRLEGKVNALAGFSEQILATPV